MENLSDCKIRGLGGLHPNTTITFTAHGIEVRVSLGIKPGIRKYLSPNNVFVSNNKRYNFALRKNIDSQYICKKNVEYVQKELLHRCMVSIREAEIKNKQKEINNLKSKL